MIESPCGQAAERPGLVPYEREYLGWSDEQDERHFGEVVTHGDTFTFTYEDDDGKKHTEEHDTSEAYGLFVHMSNPENEDDQQFWWSHTIDEFDDFDDWAEYVDHQAVGNYGLEL